MDAFLAIASKRDWRSYAADPLPDEVVERILDAGRLAGSARNRQPWELVVVQGAPARAALAAAVYVPENVQRAALVVALLCPSTFDAGRCAQNMMLAAWNEGVVSCPNGNADAEAAARAVGAAEAPATVLTFAYPARRLDPEARTAGEWSEEARRKPLGEVVRHV